MRIFILLVMFYSVLPNILLASCQDTIIQYLENISPSVIIPKKRLIFRNWRTADTTRQMQRVKSFRNDLRQFGAQIKRMNNNRVPNFLVYPAGGFDLATADLLFPETQFIVIINDVGPFLNHNTINSTNNLDYSREAIWHNPEWGWGLGLTHFGRLQNRSAVWGIAPLILARHKTYFGNRFRPISITAYPSKSSGGYGCHGCLEYQLGHVKKTLIYIQAKVESKFGADNGQFSTQIAMGSKEGVKTPIPISLFEPMDVLLGRGSMGFLDVNGNLSTFFSYVKRNKGLLVEGCLDHKSQWELSHKYLVDIEEPVQELVSHDGEIKITRFIEIYAADGKQYVVDHVSDPDILFSYAKGLQAVRLKE